MNFNIMLDALPEEFEGIPIYSDFRTGVEMRIYLADPDLTDQECIALCIRALFGENAPEDPEQGLCGVNWFLHGWSPETGTQESAKGKESKGESAAEERMIDMDVDQWRIYTAFYRQYGIDLNTADMHYWTFMGLLSNLDECALTKVIDIRMRQPNNKMSAEERKWLADAKRQYQLKSRRDVLDERAFERRKAQLMKELGLE